MIKTSKKGKMMKYNPKKLFAITSLSIAFGALALASVPPQVFDFIKINEALKTSLDQTTTDLSHVEKFNYSIDATNTNVAEDQYLFNFSGTLKDVPWSTSSVSTEGTLGVNVRPEGKEGMEFKFSKTTHTDSVELSKYLSNIVLNIPVPSSLNGIVRLQVELKRKLAQKIVTTRNLSELKYLLESHLIEMENATRNYINDLNDSLDVVFGSTLLTYVADQKVKANQVLRAIQSASIRESGDGFKFSTPGFSYDEFLSIKDVNVEFQKDKISVAGVLKVNTGEMLYDAAKPEIVRWLSGLEKGDVYSSELTKADARIWLSYGEMLLKKFDDR